MNNAQSIASRYFQSYQDYFWQWEIDYMFYGSVINVVQDYQGGINCISIPDGMTIAYKEQIEQVLKIITPNGIPPFGSLILAFLATNPGEVRFAINQIFNENLQEILVNRSEFSTETINLEDARKFLDILIMLPESYKKGKRRMDLFAFLFENKNYTLSSKHADEVLTLIKNKEFELNECGEKRQLTITAFSKDINALAYLYFLYPTKEALLKAWLKIETVPVELEDTEIHNFSDNPDLLQQLLEDPKTFFMGSLVKRIWSGIQLPMHYVHPGEMPLGGISDITNKGTFDNILLSEFANDDLIFLHRIANKEALFVRRETTPEEDLRTRIFLIDTTIKNWGTPKILSFATAFSLIHHPKNEMNFLSFVLGEKYKNIHFDTKENIIENLQLTSASLDAANALSLFLNECEEENIEITFFTTPKTLEHAAIRSIFNKHNASFGSIITADAGGNIKVYTLKNGSKRLAKHIVLPLEELWAKPPRKRRAAVNPEKKQNTNIVNYPVLYGYPVRSIINFTDEYFSYVLQKNGDLFKTYTRQKGFEMIQKEMRFVTGIQQQKLATLFEGELLILYWSADHEMIFKTASYTIKYKGDHREFQKNYLKHLMVLEGELYLVTKQYYNDDPVYTRFHIHELTYEKIVQPKLSLLRCYRNHLSNYVSYAEGSVFSKIRTITITNELELIFNEKHKLNISGNSIQLQLLREKLDNKNVGLTTYVYKRELMIHFEDGSTIEIDKNGVLIFKSSNDVIPIFYLSSYIGIQLALATTKEFAGDMYFYPEKSKAHKISAESFERKYLIPFLKHILHPWK
ncbi:hypothetical protein [Kordia zhangzhouensis]|uniref:hypothetical protein n=1 Tax=Kordia zhangzhouensis TaxID=1620405 RepID=UPI0012FBE213|nr:hypothetical protein [Kordia zhangzhouensis]